MSRFIRVPQAFHDYLDAAIVRFESQHVGIRVLPGNNGVHLEGEHSQQPELRSDFLQTLYREKIYAETLPMRQALLEAVLG